jgi:hypothetical protein
VALKDSLLGRDGLLAGLDADLARRALETLSQGRIPVVSLKQIRDTARSDRACYQAIVNSVMRVTKYHGLGILNGHYAIKIHDYASAPIVDDLGLRLEEDGTLQPRMAYWVSFDCSYGEGENLFVAPDEEPPAAPVPRATESRSRSSSA